MANLIWKFVFYLFIWEREKKGERERFVVLLLCSFISWLLYKTWLGIKPTTLAYRDDTVTTWAAQPQQQISFLCECQISYVKNYTGPGCIFSFRHVDRTGLSTFVQSDMGHVFRCPSPKPGVFTHDLSFLTEPELKFFAPRHLETTESSVWFLATSVFWESWHLHSWLSS